MEKFKTFKQWQKIAGKRGEGSYAFESYADDMAKYESKVNKEFNKISKSKKYWK